MSAVCRSTDPLGLPSVFSSLVRRGRRVVLSLLCAVLLPVSWGLSQDVGGDVGVEVGTGDVEFARDVQPIFASRCLKCHGPDLAEADLDLSDPESFAELEQAYGLGEGADDSLDDDSSLRGADHFLLERITTEDESLRMPPEGQPLTSSEVALISSWLSAGAVWSDHWAYQPLVSPVVSGLKHESDGLGDASDTEALAAGPIDVFVSEQRRKRGLSGAVRASSRTLLRRLSFDLRGLPVAPWEWERFAADDRPDAWERQVDRWLASPQLGERWARHWMDWVHFAETHGHDQDRPREHAWPYRDYLIASFNADKSYGEFVSEQLAGDVLAPLDPQAVVATGFLAAGPWDESSLRDIQAESIDRVIGQYLDRDDVVTTVMSTLASTSLHCARCHDHKFDPISQEEYYGLQAVFAGIDKANRPYDPDPEVARRRWQLEQELSGVRSIDLSVLAGAKATKTDSSDADSSDADSTSTEAELAKLMTPARLSQLAAWEQQRAERPPVWRSLSSVEVTSTAGAELTVLADGSVLVGGLLPEKDVYVLEGESGLAEISGIRLEVLPDESLPAQGPGRAGNGNLHLNAVRLFSADEGEDALWREMRLSDPQSDFDQAGWEIGKSLDGNPNTAWGIYPEVAHAHWAWYTVTGSEVRQGESGDRRLRLELHQLHGASHLIGRFRVQVTDRPREEWKVETPLPVRIESLLERDAQERSRLEQAELVLWFEQRRLEEELQQLPVEQLVYAGSNDFAPDGSFRPAAEPRPVEVLSRGLIDQPRGPATAGGLECVSTLSAEFAIEDAADEGARRIAFARWLTSADNPLVWRSMANRVWLVHFGRGIVDTPNDFGRMGSYPTHPELLDWLAASLREDGSLKRLHRAIVCSATYQQDSVSDPRGLEHDAGNRWLWRMNRRRLDAESYRDALLAVSGSLDSRMGGPSVKQFIQSPGVHVTPVVDYQGFDVKEPGNRRRSVYRFIFRTIPDPFMEALDCPDASQLTPKRNVSLTAIQSLATLHDKFVVYQSEMLAGRLESEAPTLEARVELAFRLLFQRLPTVDERAAVVSYAESHGLSNACRYLLNTNEFLFLD